MGERTFNWGRGLANGRLRSELAGGLGAILPIYRIPCQEFGESHFPSSCQIPYTVQKSSLFPKPHSISVNSRYPIILLQTLLNVYTVISRKVVGKMCTWKFRKVIWDMINTLFLTLQLSNLLLLLSFSTRKHTSIASLAILSNFFEERWTQNHPQYLSGLSRALFPTTFLEIAANWSPSRMSPPLRIWREQLYEMFYIILRFSCI